MKTGIYAAPAVKELKQLWVAVSCSNGYRDTHTSVALNKIKSSKSMNYISPYILTI